MSATGETAEEGTAPARSAPRAGRRRPPVVEDLLALRARPRLAGGLMLLAAPLLVIALFLPWSHQFSPSVLRRYGRGPALLGIPRSPDAWQVLSALDVGMLLLAVALAAVALAGGRRACLGLLGFLAVALAFCAHASSVPPTVGADLWNAAAHRYVDTGARSGSGEVLALVALATGTAGALLGGAGGP